MKERNGGEKLRQKGWGISQHWFIFNVLPQSSGRPTFSSGSMKSRSGLRVGDSGSFLDMISYHNFCPDRNTKFPKIPTDRSFGSNSPVG